MGAWLKLEVSAGTSIESVSEDACRIARLLGVSVEFKFNDVTCFASPRGDPALLAQRQQDEQGRKLSGPLDWRRTVNATPETTQVQP